MNWWSLSFLFFSLCVYVCAYRGSECVPVYSPPRARVLLRMILMTRGFAPQNTFRVYNFFYKNTQASAKNDVSTILLKILGEAAA
jgi:hypothetical protein